MVRLTISVPPLEILFRRAKPIPKPMTTPQKGIDNGILRQGATGTNWIKKELMDTVIKVKTVNLMANLIPSQDHQRKINGVEG